jgi:hypothetical protein
MIENIYKVPKKQWKKWAEVEQELFNALNRFMEDNQNLCLHPSVAPLLDEHWKTTAWNAAWMAAEFMRDMRKDHMNA